MAKKMAKFAFFGLLTGYILTVFLGHWTWLEMRVNTSLFLPAGLIIGLVLGIFYKGSLNKIYFFLLEIIYLIAFFAIYRDMGAFEVIPAVRLREGFFLGSLPLNQLNIILLILIFTGNILWLLRDGNFSDTYKINRWRM